jgi:PAS domain-containing protein
MGLGSDGFAAFIPKEVGSDFMSRILNFDARFGKHDVQHVTVITTARPGAETRRCFRQARWRNLAFSDIIDRKRAENALLQAHNELENRVRERTKDLTRANLILRDEITARKRADGALRESEERFRLMIEGTRDYAIFMLDAQDRVATCEPRTG